MKHIKPYKIFENKEPFNLEDAMSKIKNKYSESSVAEIFDDEVMNWLDDGWEEDHETEFDWYMSFGNREAEDVVISDMIKWYKGKYNVELTTDEEIKLSEEISDEYDML